MAKVFSFFQKNLFWGLLLGGVYHSLLAQDMDNSPDNTVTTFYFIRHAEKAKDLAKDGNPDLSDLGEERARKWTSLFKFEKLDAIYSTLYKRTLHTAGPTAEAKKLEIKKLDYPDIPYELLLKTYKGKKVIFVGHSNTTPEMVNHFLGKDKFDQLQEDDYSSLFMVTLDQAGARVTRFYME